VARIERLDLFAVERDLLLLTRDGQLARVRRFARRGGGRLRLDQLDPQASEIRVLLC
jgi:phage repressor protein C with HTH and peptisase S24 domain